MIYVLLDVKSINVKAMDVQEAADVILIVQIVVVVGVVLVIILVKVHVIITCVLGIV